jgi:hypothetical protein
LRKNSRFEMLFAVKSRAASVINVLLSCSLKLIEIVPSKPAQDRMRGATGMTSLG